MSKPWEYMSRDEKLDYIKERLESIDASLAMMARHVGRPSSDGVSDKPEQGDDRQERVKTEQNRKF